MKEISVVKQEMLCSMGFITLGAARLFFQTVYDQIEHNIDEEAKKNQEYRALKKKNQVAAAKLRKRVRDLSFSPEEKKRYKFIMKHIEDLMKDFEWVDSYAMFGHLNIKLKSCEFVDLFDAFMVSSNDLARLIILWADYKSNNNEDNIRLESWLKLNTKTQEIGDLASIFYPNEEK